MTPSNLALVAQFMKIFDQPVSQGFDEKAIFLGISLITEEYMELAVAAKNIVSLTEAPTPAEKEHFIKELADLLYVTYWTAAAIGIDLDAVLREVHASNMSKLDEEGKPIYRADGKILKSPLYREPDLSHLAAQVPITII